MKKLMIIIHLELKPRPKCSNLTTLEIPWVKVLPKASTGVKGTP
jgi:hypothetical protein